MTTKKVRDNKKSGKGCFKPSEHILYLKLFPPPIHCGQYYQAFSSELLSRFPNKSGWTACYAIYLGYFIGILRNLFG